jgi:hypothetical protein
LIRPSATRSNRTRSPPLGAKTITPKDPAAAQPKLRSGTKQAALISMLRTADGATIEEIMTATGWQSHTIRGAMAGVLKKKLGLEVSSEKDGVRGRVYRLPSA